MTVCGTAFTALLGSALGAQSVQPRPLRSPAVALSEEFTSITSVRELADGRLLVVDGGEDTRLATVDWRTQRVGTLGREGQGPGEYRSIGKLLATGGDSTLVEDRRNGRLLVLDGSRFVSTVSMVAPNRRGLPFLAGADRHGRVLQVWGSTFGRPPGMPVVPMHAYADSLVVVLTTGMVRDGDTLAHVRGRFRPMREVMKPVVRGGPPVPNVIGNPLAAEEQALLFPDGWVAVAYANPYRVEWHRPDGRITRGASLLPFATVAVDARQKRAAVARHYPADAGMTPDDMPPWPATLPPFLNDALLAAPAGQLVIRRTPDATRPGTFYDVVDRTGKLTGKLALEANERIVGFGANSVYVVERDQDGLEWLRRHPWP